MHEKKPTWFIPNMDVGQIIQVVCLLVGIGSAGAWMEAKLQAEQVARGTDVAALNKRIDTSDDLRNLRLADIADRLEKVDKNLSIVDEMRVSQATMEAKVDGLAASVMQLRVDVQDLEAKPH